MRTQKRKLLGIWGLCLLLLMSSCGSKELQFHVTKPAQLPVENIKNLSIDSFEDQLGVSILLPKGAQSEPGQFSANARAADLLRAQVVADLSTSGQYRLLNTTGADQGYSGVIPEAGETGIIRARVRYFERIQEGNDPIFYVLTVKNNNMPLEKRLLVEGLKLLVVRSAERSGKGFKVPIPYVEELVAMEVDFDFIRQSDGSKIIPTQTFRQYFWKKWGGDPEKSIFPLPVVSVFRSMLKQELGMLGELEGMSRRLQQQIQDPQEFIALGLHLKQNPQVPLLPLDLKNKMASRIAREYVKRISRYHEIAKLEIASGDAIGANLIRGNAYNAAINRLEGLSKPLSSEDGYNLGLAYEASGEFIQASKIYRQALDRDAGNTQLKQAIRRVKR